MITSINKDNQAKYQILFEEATELLAGFLRVRTFSAIDTPTYYYKNLEASTKEELFKAIPSGEINTLSAFVDNLNAHNGVLYVKYNYEPTADNPDKAVLDTFDPIHGITSLEEYFAYIKTIANIFNNTESDVSGGRKYTTLPLDEQPFIINANTRAITVPADFRKNGIAVQGDDLAETVYFKINRYFDAMDFNNTQIFIQWETPKGPNGLSKKGVSKEFIRDIESEPGYLIFGWNISDIITEYAGQLKFSVLFYQIDEENNLDGEGGNAVEKHPVVYAFNTLVSSCNIQPSIGINIEKDELIIDDAGSRLIDRLENGEVVGGYEVASPEFIEVYEDSFDLVDGVPKLVRYFDMTQGDDGLQTTLYATAYSPDTGALTYSWYKQGLDGENVREDGLLKITENCGSFYQPIYFSSSDSESKFHIDNLLSEPNAQYYEIYKGANQETRYSGTLAAAKEEYENTLSSDKPAFWVRRQYCVVDEVGSYSLLAENRVSFSVAGKRTEPAIFPNPLPITKAHYVDNNEEEITGVILPQGEEKVIGISYGEIDATTDEADKIEENKITFNYQWYKQAGSGSDYTALSGETGQTLTISAADGGVGNYKATISKVRNGVSVGVDEAERAEFNEKFVRVTPPAAKISWRIDGTKIYSIVAASRGDFDADDSKVFQPELEAYTSEVDEIFLNWIYESELVPDTGKIAIYDEDRSFTTFAELTDEAIALRVNTTMINGLVNKINEELPEDSKINASLLSLGTFYPVFKVDLNNSIAISDEPNSADEGFGFN